MSAVEVPQNVIDLSKYIDVSKYTVYTLELSRLSSGYLVNSNTNVTVVDKPGYTQLSFYLRSSSLSFLTCTLGLHCSTKLLANRERV